MTIASGDKIARGRSGDFIAVKLSNQKFLPVSEPIHLFFGYQATHLKVDVQKTTIDPQNGFELHLYTTIPDCARSRFSTLPTVPLVILFGLLGTSDLFTCHIANFTFIDTDMVSDSTPADPTPHIITRHKSSDDFSILISSLEPSANTRKTVIIAQNYLKNYNIIPPYNFQVLKTEADFDLNDTMSISSLDTFASNDEERLSLYRTCVSTKSSRRASSTGSSESEIFSEDSTITSSSSLFYDKYEHAFMVSGLVYRTQISLVKFSPMSMSSSSSSSSSSLASRAGGAQTHINNMQLSQMHQQQQHGNHFHHVQIRPQYQPIPQHPHQKYEPLQHYANYQQVFHSNQAPIERQLVRKESDDFKQQHNSQQRSIKSRSNVKRAGYNSREARFSYQRISEYDNLEICNMDKMNSIPLNWTRKEKQEGRRLVRFDIVNEEELASLSFNEDTYMGRDQPTESPPPPSSSSSSSSSSTTQTPISLDPKNPKPTTPTTTGSKTVTLRCQEVTHFSPHNGGDNVPSNIVSCIEFEGQYFVTNSDILKLVYGYILNFKLDSEQKKRLRVLDRGMVRYRVCTVDNDCITRLKNYVAPRVGRKFKRSGVVLLRWEGLKMCLNVALNYKWSKEMIDRMNG